MPCTTPSTHRGPKKWCFRLSGSDTPPVTPCKTFTKSEFWGWIILRHPLTSSQPLQHKCPKIKQRWHSYTPSWLTWPIGFPLFRHFCESPRSFIMFYSISLHLKISIRNHHLPRVTSPQMGISKSRSLQREAPGRLETSVRSIHSSRVIMAVDSVD